ncbi:MAG: mechanosensitive ion channel, partial [candidate division Zixibacteria bacterium]|nr:mechanosensitive ion channel [candidate division Zixibacteria bacterium]
MTSALRDWLIDLGIAEGIADYLTWLVLVVAVIALSLLVNYITRRFLVALASYLVRKSHTRWDDFLLKHKVFTRLSHLAPAIVIYFSAYLFPAVEIWIQRFAVAYLLLVGYWTFNSFLNAVADIYGTLEISRQRPIKGYLQVVKIVVFIIISIVVIATILGQKIGYLLGGLGAMTAVLMLIFKDSILGLMAGIQLSLNDMVRIGDWIEMPRYGADGDVIDLSLHTVKVQNWDKTISTIPAYYLISDSFKNWRGMDESGGRRIKRSINIDITSIKFLTAEMLDRFDKFQLLKEYLDRKRKEVAEWNQVNEIDTSVLINGRHLTNIGTFRAYVIAYLRSHPKIHQEMTFLVRQLPAGDNGLPMEIYVFSRIREWAEYEAIQADIFDHLLAVTPLFELRVFQHPTGDDFR